LVVSGTGCGEPGLLEAAAAVAAALVRAGKPAKLSFALLECNSLGLALLGGERPLEEALEEVRSGRAEALLVVENDLFRRWEAGAVTELLERAPLVAVVDHLRTRTSAMAHLLLPAASFAEAEGSLVNNEGRAQRFFKVRQPPQEVRESWRWITRMAAARDGAVDGKGLDALLAELARKLPHLAGVRDAAPAASFRLNEQKVPRQHARYTGRTSMTADLDVQEPGPPADPDSPLSFTMEGYPGRVPAALRPRLWAPGWNSVQALNKFQEEVGGPLRGGDPGVRLLEPTPREQPAYFLEAPPAFEPRAGEWLILPVHHIFGSEELSALAPAVAARAPKPSLALHPEDAAGLGLAPGETAELSLGGSSVRLPVAPDPSLPRGTAGAPAGLPGLTGIESPAWSAVRKVMAP